jgi:hypothetical protein
MIFKKDTLTDNDKVAIVNTIAVTSLVKFFSVGDLLSTHERSLIGIELFAKVNGRCSTWVKSKLTAYADNVATLIIKTPVLHDAFERLIVSGKIEEATQRLANITFNGLTMNGHISGSQGTFGAEPYMDELDVELEKISFSEGPQEVTLNNAEDDGSLTTINKTNPISDQSPSKEPVDQRICIYSPQRAYHDRGFKIKWHANEGEIVEASSPIFTLEGPNEYQEINSDRRQVIESIKVPNGTEVSASGILLGFASYIVKDTFLKADEHMNDKPLLVSDTNQRLINLKSLYDNGLITEAVYENKQNEILSNI